MVKVLVVNTVPFEVNGMSSVIINYFKSMNNEGIKCDFIANGSIYDKYKEEIEMNGGKVLLLSKKKSKPVKYIKELNNIVKNGEYDIIHVHGNSALMEIEMNIAKRNNIPIRISHSHNTTCSFKLLHTILYPFFIRDCTHRFACGEEAGKWLYKNNEFKVIKNGIDVEKYKFNDALRENYREKLKVKDKKVLCHVGNFSYQKNHDFLIDIFKEVVNKNDNYMLFLIGSGKLEDEIKNKVKELNISDKVVFVGRSQKVSEYMNAADALVFPSRFEGLPLTLIEAQVSGLKCFISDRISDEVEISNLIEFISLDEKAEKWAEKITNCDFNSSDRKNTYMLAEKEGYDIKANGRYLSELYLQYSIGGAND